ncbi:MAG TPA: hypothetical protein VHO67_08720 [Polyangia bacterium]|nr:hypothetical protein [Polyangia bacterium]
MKVRVLMSLALICGSLPAAKAQEVTPEAPSDMAPSSAAPYPAAPPPSPEVAAPAPGFGAKGQLAVSIDVPLMSQGPQFAFVHQTTTMSGPTSTRVDVQPSVDYFVAPDLSVGAQLGVDYLTIRYNDVLAPGAGQAVNVANGTTQLSVQARLGYDVPIGDSGSVWFRVGIGYTYTRTSYVYTPDVSGYTVPFSFSAPILWHVGRHFFIGAGPAFVTQLVSRNAGADAPKATEYGITALIGGTLGGG